MHFYPFHVSLRGDFKFTGMNNLWLPGVFREEIQSPGRLGFVAKFAGGGILEWRNYFATPAARRQHGAAGAVDA